LTTSLPIHRRLAGDFAARPVGIVVDPGGTLVYVANGWLGNQSVDGNVYMTIIDAATNEIFANVLTGPNAADTVAMNVAGTRVYSSNGAIIDTASNEIVGTLSLPTTCCVAVNSNGTRIYAVIQTPPSLVVVDAETNALLATLFPWRACLTPSGSFLGPSAEIRKRATFERRPASSVRVRTSIAQRK
jgi:DNA-binding beta-propeller fold protein YncE